MSQPLLPIPDFTALPAPIYFRHDEFGAGARCETHAHAWGQLNYASQGVMELNIAGSLFLSPPQYAVWIPPNAAHSSYNRSAIVYRSVYIAQELCNRLPVEACTLVLSPVLKAILNDCADRNIKAPQTDADRRLAQVVLDQLEHAPVEKCYLPFAETPALTAVLSALQDQPSDNRSQAEWAAQVHITERTLARHCVKELGMPLGEWRQRLRFLRAIEALKSNQSIQEIAFDLGYSTASAFIAMFQRLAGTTPEQYRKLA